DFPPGHPARRLEVEEIVVILPGGQPSRARLPRAHRGIAGRARRRRGAADAPSGAAEASGLVRAGGGVSRRAWKAASECRSDPEQPAGRRRAACADGLPRAATAGADRSRRAATAYLAGGGTLPDHRGRGAYTALVRARWEAAAERGTPVLTVGAGTMSRPTLERLGFSIVGWEDCLLDPLD